MHGVQHIQFIIFQSLPHVSSAPENVSLGVPFVRIYTHQPLQTPFHEQSSPTAIVSRLQICCFRRRVSIFSLLKPTPHLSLFGSSPFTYTSRRFPSASSTYPFFLVSNSAITPKMHLSTSTSVVSVLLYTPCTYHHRKFINREQSRRVSFIFAFLPYRP
jgi:hypothetical protein